MSQATAEISQTASLIEAAGHPEWLRDRKLADLATYAHLPVPDSATMEDWRRTDLSGLDLDRIVPAPGGAPRLTSDPALVAQGVVVSTLEEAARTHPEVVRRHLEQEVVPAAAGKFAALNSALWRDGVFVFVPRNVVAAVPVWAAFAAPAPADGLPTVLPRSLVVLEEGASLVFTEEFAGGDGGGAGLSSAVTEVVLGDGASIQYLVLQQWPDDMTHVATHRLHLGRDARAELVVAATGAAVSKVYMEVAMMGENGSARISGLVIGDGKQHFDYQSLQDHFAPHCESDLLVKGALGGESVSVYSGLIKIRKDAQHSNAYQANRNLMLSGRAHADSIPRLEIEANDVRCTHGATVGQVDSEQLFYLQSRGFSAREAQDMLVHGFFQPVIDRIALPEVREQIHAAIDRALAGVEPTPA